MKFELNAYKKEAAKQRIIAIRENSSDSYPTKTIRPIIPIKIPKNCTQLEESFSQNVAIRKENKGVVPLSTDMVPAFRSNAAFEKR